MSRPKVWKYTVDEIVEFQRTVIKLANEIPKELKNPDELKNIARTLKEIAYNKPIEL